MRPVQRGPNATVFADYKKARIPLIDAIGDYCSYCEMSYQAAVEHVLPWEGKHTSLELTWDNFLLACTSCNTYMRNRQDYEPITDAASARAKYLWPDVDNTARAFEHDPSNRVTVSGSLDPAVKPIADATHQMLALDVTADLRWKRRKSAWTEAEHAARRLQAKPSPEMREQIAATAAGRGFWSVWRAVFADDPDMLTRLNAAFTGTDPSSFDPATCALVARPGGQL